jgi:formylglycine-generating enzyme required for sulfatase activity
MGKHEVTRDQFAAFVKATGYRTDAEKAGWAYTKPGNKWKKTKGASWRNPGFEQHGNHPVVCITWNDAKAFCEWLAATRGEVFRLPSEAEWEYAARAGSETDYHWGNRPEKGSGWFNGADASYKKRFSNPSTFFFKDGYATTSPVGSFRANPWNLHDLHGNVWEWCEDWFDADYYKRSPTEDPRGPVVGDFRAFRGGSWNSARDLRLSSRGGGRTTVSRSDNGFRVVYEFAQ